MSRLHIALVTEMIDPLQEYGGDLPEPDSAAAALAWLERERASASARWALPDSARCDDALASLQLMMMQCARGASFTTMITSIGGVAGEDVRYAVAIAIGSGARTPVQGGDLSYALIGEPLTDIVNHAELLPDADLPALWSWLGRACGLVTEAWPAGNADFRPLGH